MTQVQFDANSAHVFVLKTKFRDGVVDTLYCSLCKTTRNLLAREIVMGRVDASLRTHGAFLAQCSDPECVHVGAFKIMATNLPSPPRGVDLSSVCDIVPGCQFGVTSLDMRTQLFASVQAHGNPLDRVLLVLEGENSWKCTTCPRNDECSHRTTWQSFQEAAHADMGIDMGVDMEWLQDDVEQTSTPWVVPAVSFPVQAHLQAEVRMRRGFHTLSQMTSTAFVPRQLHLPVCPCGSPYNEEARVPDCVGTVYGVLHSVQIVVQQFRCTNLDCTNLLPFDGFYHGFLRTGRTTFIDLDLVNLIRLNTIVGATPMSATLDINLAKSFNCPHCGSLDTAPIIIGDGNAKMACRREYSTTRQAYPRHSIPRHGIPLEHRQYIRHAETRKQLLNFCGSRAFQGDNPPNAMTPGVHNHLRALLVDHAEDVVPLLDVLVYGDECVNGLCPRQWREFLGDLARQSPVQNAVVRSPNVMARVLLDLGRPSRRRDAFAETTTLSNLQRNMPSLASALRATGMDVDCDHPMWPALSPILTRLSVVFCTYLQTLPANEQTPPPDDLDACTNTYTDEDLHEWFPGAPCRRTLGAYQDQHRKDDTICSKSAPSVRYKMPGIFHFCCPHGICLGFSVMHDHESPVHPFSILCQRWSNSDYPRVVIMDNACNLHTYCLRREPYFFRNVWFLVDRLHYCNHVNCSSGYKVDNFPFLKDISTVACEAFNSSFKAVVKQAGFMGMDNFILFTKHFITSTNDRRIENLKTEIQAGGMKCETWRSVNALISNLELPSNRLPCVQTDPCSLCAAGR
ncbi:hypothetical protein H257_18951 [Aphanomyces astaci]|uniref:HMG domain-containing protein n=1 Tax=Aphanomyces astaci TaxID=112090 RepID=W4F9J0_APHAT|nr:hypothetical protein H257_18951 [Aphanomyces astaci]ETV64117.1 hypothetical protein H257_18951 [Aphanomyces astaci]|eukprot:XP_009846402.1 hypothetical protein H257_18951 [Aphanomyces astaci]